jgi:high-affinity Fe2+/Pb2+ permease
MTMENEKDKLELLPGEKVVTARKALETILEILMLASVLVGLFALVWGKWLTLRICITVFICCVMIVAVWWYFDKEEKC